MRRRRIERLRARDGGTRPAGHWVSWPRRRSFKAHMCARRRQVTCGRRACGTVWRLQLDSIGCAARPGGGGLSPTMRSERAASERWPRSGGGGSFGPAGSLEVRVWRRSMQRVSALCTRRGGVRAVVAWCEDGAKARPAQMHGPTQAHNTAWAGSTTSSQQRLWSAPGQQQIASFSSVFFSIHSTIDIYPFKQSTDRLGRQLQVS